MKIIRYFIREEDQATGERGFMPLWVPRSAGFNASDARGMMHDSLEHRLCDTGKPFEEVLAFGRIIALRYLPGVIRMQNTGHELHALVRNAPDFPGDWDLALPDPGRVELPEGSDDVHTVISAMIKEMATAARREEVSTDGPAMTDAACVRMARLLRLGFLDGMRRYGGYGGCSNLGWLADNWAESNSWRVEVMAKECNDGDVLRVTIDTQGCGVNLRLISDGRRLDWLRPRIHNWYTA